MSCIKNMFNILDALFYEVSILLIIKKYQMNTFCVPYPILGTSERTVIKTNQNISFLVLLF